MAFSFKFRVGGGAGKASGFADVRAGKKLEAVAEDGDGDDEGESGVGKGYSKGELEADVANGVLTSTTTAGAGIDGTGSTMLVGLFVIRGRKRPCAAQIAGNGEEEEEEDRKGETPKSVRSPYQTGAMVLHPRALFSLSERRR